MSKFASYSYAQLKFASDDIRQVLDIWKDSPDSSYVRDKWLELDMVRDEMMKRQLGDIKVARNRLLKDGVDGAMATMMATWMVREGISLEVARERADMMYWDN